jgi:hypothetical protein
MSTLRKLPPEIRLMIWRECMNDSAFYFLKRITVALRGDQELYMEVLGVYYATKKISSS